MNGLAVKGDGAGYVKAEHAQISLDSFCAQRGLSPQVIKIDVEGAEHLVLQGAMETLRRCKPKVFLSIHPAHLKMLGSSTEELLAIIQASGYACREIDGSPVTSFRLGEYLLVPETR